MKKVRMGAGSGYAPSDPMPAVKLVKDGNLDYIGFDQLAELTMSIMQRTKMKDSSRGFVWQHIINGMKLILPPAKENGVKIITNGGGANPLEAAKQVAAIAKENGYTGTKIGICTGDDILDKLDSIVGQGWKFENLDTGEEDFGRIKDKIVSAHAYVGADAIVGALEEDAEIVISGRCSDNALYVGPLMHEFGWKFTDEYWDRIGAAITVGHIIECAEWCTGNASVLWEQVPDFANIGYPIAEFSEDGTAIITKPEGTGGLVNEWTIKEHLVYEVHDPANYIMPDGIADMTTLKLKEIGENRVLVDNMTGKPRPDTLKVQVGFLDGYIAESMVIIGAPDVIKKLKKIEEIGRIKHEKLKSMGINAHDLRIDYIGLNSLLGNLAPIPDEKSVNEVGFRVAAKANTAMEASMVMGAYLSSAQAIVGTAWGRPIKPRSVISLWPTLVPRDMVPVNYSIMEVE